MNSSGRAGWRGVLAVSLFWLAVVAGVVLFVRRPSAQPVEILPPPTAAPTATPPPTPTPRPLRVDVAGAVVQPQVIVLPPGSIVADAIAAAGGPAADADLDRVNKAVALQDGMQIYVPRLAGATAEPPIFSLAGPTPFAERSGQVDLLAGSIDLNTASLAALETLPGVGPKIAQLIVDGRPYAVVDDLLKVKGIGPATLDKIRDLVTVR